MIIFVPISFIVTAATILFTFSLMQTHDFEHMPTKELSVFELLMYGGITAMIVITVLVIIVAKRISLMKSKIDVANKTIEQIKDRPTSDLAGQVVDFEKKLVRTWKIGRYSAWTILAIGITTSLVVAYFAYMLYNEHTIVEEVPTGQFIVENLKGDTINTWVAWQLSEGETLHISVINSDLVSADKIAAIKEAILSEETIDIPNSEMGKVPEDLVATYYVGWRGALQEASQRRPQIDIPTDLHIELSDKPVGEIVIVLTNLRESDGTLGFTKSIADDRQNQILKSTITIFDVENLDSHKLSAVIRHEFGHAMGLGHSTASEDLMHPRFNSLYPYISGCDVDAIYSLYDKRGSSAVVCEN